MSSKSLNVGAVKAYVTYLAQYVNRENCVFCFRPMGLPYGKVVTPDDLLSDDLHVLKCLEKHHYCFSYVAYLHESQVKGAKVEDIRSYEEALCAMRGVGVDVGVEMEMEKEVSPKLSCSVVEELSMKRKRLIDETFCSVNAKRPCVHDMEVIE